MRDGFREIVSGWMLVDDVEELGERIERAAAWSNDNGPLEADEQATVKLMIQSQIARGIVRGDFEPFVPGGDPELAQWLLQGEIEPDA
jgi:hypothetical protein